jgi:hypothetical protein
VWKRLKESSLGEWVYCILVFSVIVPQIIIFISALAESVYYSISAGNTLISFYLVFRYSYAFLFKGDKVVEQVWVYYVIILTIVAVMSVVRSRRKKNER